MTYQYKLVTQLKPVRQLVSIMNPKYIGESGPFLVNLAGYPREEVPATESYNSLRAWGRGNVKNGTSLFTKNITGCIVVAVYCNDPLHLGMVHFGACDSNRKESYDDLLVGIPSERRAATYAIAVMSKPDPVRLAKSQFEGYVFPQLSNQQIPANNIILYHDRTEDCLAFGLTPIGDIGTPWELRKEFAKV